MSQKENTDHSMSLLFFACVAFAEDSLMVNFSVNGGFRREALESVDNIGRRWLFGHSSLHLQLV